MSSVFPQRMLESGGSELHFASINGDAKQVCAIFASLPRSLSVALSLSRPLSSGSRTSSKLNAIDSESSPAEQIRRLVATEKHSVGERDANGNTALHLAMQ